jgi:hypothetical protein
MLMPPERVYSDKEIVAFLSDRMSAEEAASLRAQALRDQALAAELALADGLLAAERGDPDRPPPSDTVWKRISGAIEADRTEGPRRASPAPMAFAQMAAAAAFAVAVWHFAVIPLLDRPQTGADQYQPASADHTPFTAKATFHPTAQEAAIRAALLKANANIVAGPSAIGVYDLRFDGADAQASGVASLRAEADVVETVEALTPP